MFNTMKKRVSIGVLICMVLVMISPIMAYASFYYDFTSGRLSGGVYVNDPTKVKVAIVPDSNSVSQVTYLTYTGSVSIYTYDDNNVPIRTGGYSVQLPANQPPSKIILYACNQSYELPETNHSNYSSYNLSTADNFRGGNYRIPGDQFFSETAGDTYLSPGSRLVDFTPIGNNVNRFQIYFPYSGSNYTQVVNANTDITDFTLTDVTVGQNVYLQSIPQLNTWNATFQAQPNFIPGHKYEFSMSSTSAGNELKLPVGGLYKSTIFFDQNYTAAYFDNIPIGNAVAGGSPNSNDGGAPFGDMSNCSTSGGSNPTGSGSSSGSSSSDSTPTTTTPVQEEEWIAANTLDDNQFKNVGKVTKENDAEGNLFTQVNLDVDKFNEGLQLLQGKSSKDQILQMELKNYENRINVIIPVLSLTDALHNTPNGIISMGVGTSRYDFPIRVIDPEKLSKQMNMDVKDLQVVLHITKVEGTAADSVTNQTKKLGASILAEPYDVSITIEAKGMKVPFNDYANTYVTRTINLPLAVDPSKVTGAVFETTTGKLSFVPAFFHVKDGKTEVSIKRNGTGTFAIIVLKQSFQDLDKHWAKADIDLLASKLVVNGSSDTTYSPEARVTRAEFAALLTRALGLSEDTSSAKYKDIAKNDWSAGAIGAAVKAGLIDGFEDGTFKPNSEITREQMVVMIARAQNYVNQTTDVSKNTSQMDMNFADQALISIWAQRYIAQANQAGMITGTTGNRFAPNENATRAEAATIVRRFLQVMEFIN